MSIPYQLELPEALAQRLDKLDESKQQFINHLLIENLSSYVDLAWDGEDSDETILANFTQGWHEAMTGQEGGNIWDLLRGMGYEED